MCANVLRWLAPVIGVVLCVGAMASGEASQSSFAQDVKAAICQNIPPRGHPVYSETDAEAFAAKYGTEAVPVLLEMLEDQGLDPLMKGKVCFFLGKLHDKRALAPMIALYEKSITPEISWDTRCLMCRITDGLGFSGDPEAIEFLKKVAGREYWVELPVRPRVPEGPWDVEQTARHFRGCALRGLALSPNPGDGALLVELKGGASSDMSERVDAYITEFQNRQQRRQGTAEDTQAQVKVTP